MRLFFLVYQNKKHNAVGGGSRTPRCSCGGLAPSPGIPAPPLPPHKGRAPVSVRRTGRPARRTDVEGNQKRVGRVPSKRRRHYALRSRLRVTFDVHARTDEGSAHDRVLRPQPRPRRATTTPWGTPGEKPGPRVLRPRNDTTLKNGLARHIYCWFCCEMWSKKPTVKFCN